MVVATEVMITVSVFPYSHSWPYCAATLQANGKMNTIITIAYYCCPACRRWIYNWIHGLTGLFLGQIAACKFVLINNQLLLTDVHPLN